jgi:hydrogenase expression/formation protein HypC
MEDKSELAVPGRVVALEPGRARVELAGGVTVCVSTALLQDVRVGNYVLVHQGYAIQLLDPEEAEKLLEEWRRKLETL